MRLLDEDIGVFHRRGAETERKLSMKFAARFFPFLWVICVGMPNSLPAQSLADTARKESERRRSLEERGISGRVIEQHETTRRGLNGSLSVFAPVPAAHQAERPVIAVTSEGGIGYSRAS